MGWLRAVIVTLNHLGNVVLGGDSDMTISARAGYAREHGSKISMGVCHVLDWIDYHDGDSPRGDHCDIAVDNHERKEQVP